MATRQNKENDSQTSHTNKASLWLGLLLVVISFASLSLVFSSFPSAAFASISPPTQVSSVNLAQQYNLNVPANIITSAGQQSKEPSKHTSSAIPSPAPLSLVALLLLVIAAAIRRHQNQV